METYESERKELILWLKAELEKIDDIPWEGGLDGEHTRQERMINAEFRKRQKALKEKYNIPDKEPENTTPTKSIQEILEMFYGKSTM